MVYLEFLFKERFICEDIFFLIREREDYYKRIDDLLNAVNTLLSNNPMGDKLEQTKAAYEDLRAKYYKLEGELAMCKHGQDAAHRLA